MEPKKQASGNIFPISFNPDGPDGFRDRQDRLPSAQLESGVPVGADHVYFARREQHLLSGIWRSEPYVEWYDSYPCDEFMYILSGEVIVGNEFKSVKYEAGAAFLIPKGFCGYWRQPVTVEKYYVIIGEPAIGSVGAEFHG